MLEVEAKIKIDSVAAVREVLLEKGAVRIKTAGQTDTYFNSPSRDFAKTDEALRIRAEDESSEITYKGPKLKQSGAKAREEFNVEIGDCMSMGGILEKLGFYKSAVVSKKREEYDLMGTKIALDIVDNLGEFIEIEVVTEQKDEALGMIENVRIELGIEGPHISTSYLEMIQAKNKD